MILFNAKHAIDDHPGHLTRDLVVGDSECSLLIRIVWQETEQVVIHLVQILSMLP
jgi:hypothetical protein